MVKNGLPPVCTNISSAKGRTKSGNRMQGVGDQPPDIVRREWPQPELLYLSCRVSNRREHPHERVRGADLVVPIGPDQQQVPHLRVRDQVLE
jgi:hypothetical protein